MTAVDVDALDKLREAATAGPWRPHGEHLVVDERGVSLIAAEVDHSDAALIVAAVNALPDLIAEVRRGRALREAVEDISEDMEINAEEVGRGEGELNEGDLERYADRLRAVLAAVDGGEQ